MLKLKIKKYFNIFLIKIYFYKNILKCNTVQIFTCIITGVKKKKWKKRLGLFCWKGEKSTKKHFKFIIYLLVHFSVPYISSLHFSTRMLPHLLQKISLPCLCSKLVINGIPETEMLPFSYDTIISYTILLHMHSQGNSISWPELFLKNIAPPLTTYPRF
jgi:hypothetical protein